MTSSTSRLSYTAEFEALERAMKDPKGARVEMKSSSEAYYFRNRCNQARMIDRRDNSNLDEDDPLYCRSAFDILVFRIKRDTEGTYWTYLEPSTLGDRVVEGLSEIEDAAE